MNAWLFPQPDSIHRATVITGIRAAPYWHSRTATDWARDPGVRVSSRSPAWPVLDRSGQTTTPGCPTTV